MFVRLNDLLIARSLARRSWHRRLTASMPGSSVAQPARGAEAPRAGAFARVI